MSQPPLAPDPSLVLHFSLPTDGTPDEQYQRVMELVQVLQGMAHTIRPPVFPITPEVQQPFSIFQAHPTALLPRPSPQLLTTPAMGATSVPSTQTPLSTQYPPLVSGGHPLRLARAQYAQSPLLGTIPVQQLLLPHFAPYTA